MASRMKITQPQLTALAYLMQCGGAVITSSWTYGSGRWTARRVIPPCCERIERGMESAFPQRIQRVFKAHPHCQAVIAITDMRTANRLVNGAK